MTKPKNRGLGKGLSALIKDTARENAGETVQELAITEVRPNPGQPRQSFSEPAMEELAESVRHHGILQPILVRPVEGGFEIVAGERRYRAAKMANLTKIPAIVRDLDPEEVAEIALIENLQREDLNPIEEARAYRTLMDRFHLTQEDLSIKIGRSRSRIANTLRLLELPGKVQEGVVEGALLVGQAKPLLSLMRPELMQKAANYVVDHNLSSRDTEDLVKRLKKKPDLLEPPQRLAEPEETVREKEFLVGDAEEKLRVFFGTKVKINYGINRSRIIIDFYSQEDLDRIIEALGDVHTDSVELKKRKLREVSWKFTT